MHSTWTATIVPGVTNELQLQNMIYTLGPHIEIMKLEEDHAPKTDGFAFLPSGCFFRLTLPAAIHKKHTDMMLIGTYSGP